MEHDFYLLDYTTVINMLKDLYGRLVDLYSGNSQFGREHVRSLNGIVVYSRDDCMHSVANLHTSLVNGQLGNEVRVDICVTVDTVIAMLTFELGILREHRAAANDDGGDGGDYAQEDDEGTEYTPSPRKPPAKKPKNEAKPEEARRVTISISLPSNLSESQEQCQPRISLSLPQSDGEDRTDYDVDDDHDDEPPAKGSGCSRSRLVI